MKNIKSNKAITLIALVITIVVLIILAIVVINLSLGNNGILNRARTATEQYQNAQGYEEERIAKYTNEIDSYVDGNRDTVTISKEEYDRLKEKGEWEKLGSSTSTSYENIDLPEGKKISDYTSIVLRDENTDGTVYNSTICSTNQFKTVPEIRFVVPNFSNFVYAKYVSETRVQLHIISGAGTIATLYGIK